MTKSFLILQGTSFVFSVFWWDQYFGPQSPKYVSDGLASVIFFNNNFGPRAKNIDFGDKFLIVTDIIFWFYGVLPFNILLENGPFSQKLWF